MKNPLILVLLVICIISCSDNNDSDQTHSQVSKPQIDEPENEPSAPKFVDKLKASISKRDFTIQEDDIVLGNPQSNVVVIEYFAMTCPHCNGFLKRTFPRIKKKYIDTNKVAYVFREFVGNKQDLYASALARCGKSKESYINFMEVLLSRQGNWAFTRKFDEVLTNIASLGGISPEEYSACIADEQISKTLIENTALPAKNPKFVGTPAFFINGEYFTKSYTFEDLSAAIDKALKESNSSMF